MYKYFNKFGNIEIEGNILKYRIGIEYVKADNIKEIENELKQVLAVNEKDIFLVPMQVEFINRFLLLYYNMQHLHFYDRLREYSLLENIPYFLSLVEIAKEYEIGNQFNWERENFVIDEFEKKVKIILPETSNLKVYTDRVNVVKAVKDMIISALTLQTTFIALPKRVDFIDASEDNVNFVEKIYKLDNLDDIQVYLETKALDLEVKKYSNDEVAVTEERKGKKKKDKVLKQKKTKPTKTTTVKTVGPTGKQPVKRFDTKTLILIAIMVVVSVILFAFITITPSEEPENTIDYSKDVTETFTYNEGDDPILNVYRAIYNTDYETAYNIINGLSNNEISPEDVPLILDVYFKNDKSLEMLEKYPNLANDYITYLISGNMLNELETFVGDQSDNPYILFELAYLKNDFESVLLYKDQVEMNARRESQIVDSLIKTGQHKAALDFAKSTNNPDLITQAENAAKY